MAYWLCGAVVSGRLPSPMGDPLLKTTQGCIWLMLLRAEALSPPVELLEPARPPL